MPESDEGKGRKVNIFCKITNQRQEDDKKTKENTDVPNSISDRDLRRLYAVEFKSQSYASYYTTSMEKDKSILTLSVAGIGFSLTLLKLAEVVNLHDLIIFVLSSLSFLGSIYAVVTMFGKNADFMIDLTQDKDVSVKQYQLQQLDKVAIRCFYIGIVLTIILGLSTSIGLINKEKNMSENEKQNVIQTEVRGISLESLQGAQQIKKSLATAAELAPSETTQPTSNSQSSSSASGPAAMKPDID
ncbi:hypothetical protein AB4559_09370 [Vibrio sp. 10N.222.51.C8]|jgi:hypothetical protein|uniref:hypothetical protein n=1 Tax=Vibrio TaxID=662 RepID=UPI001E3A54C5|nr:hypothetical protein [Vibrio sp. F13]MCC4890445.1 hypothetical protein [Vibrio sp. F13]